MRMYNKLYTINKYRNRCIRIGMFKLEICKFKKKLMIRVEFSNWDK